tara:strand:+ start:181 stop:633 length:453 start_codon:yes stop_codon:yes gene_type:complete
MPNYRNRPNIVKTEESVPFDKLKDGMIVTFRYKGGSDKTPIVLILYYDKEKKMIEGLNLNYITMSRVGRLVEIMGEHDVLVDRNEIDDNFDEDITRIQISSKKIRNNMTPAKFYKDAIKGDSIITSAYRSYKMEKISSLKAVDVKESVFK